MPRIPIPTAQTGPGTIQARAASPNSFGAQAAQGLSELGNTFDAIGQKIQDNQDRLDTLSLASQYDIALDKKKAEIASTPDLDKHGDLLADAKDSIQDELIEAKPGLSSAAEAAFRGHAVQRYTTAAIDLAHSGRALKAERQIIDLTNTVQGFVDKEAVIAPDAVFERDLGHRLGQSRERANHLIQTFVDNGTLHPKAAEQLHEQMSYRYWTQRANAHPEEVMRAVASGKLQPDDFPMDQEKAIHYNNVAVNVLHQRQAAADRAEKDAEHAIKRTQEVTAAQATADILEGTPVNVSGLVRTRSLDDSVGRTLVELQTKLATAPNLANYQRGLAPQIEATLNSLKYNGKPLPPGLDQGLISNFMEGDILKEEFTHLMTVYRGVQDHKATTGKELANQDVSHAHAKLEQGLRTTGPADKFDALSNQTIVDATEYFYRRMNQQPDADPWKVKTEAENIFKPVIEKRLGLSKQDKAVLDDARITGMVHTKAITPAAARALREQTQNEEGARIVQEALKNLPPPPPPGFLERLRGLIPKQGEAKPRNSPGVMGE